jgi:hypothetical protein
MPAMTLTIPSSSGSHHLRSSGRILKAAQMDTVPPSSA